MKGFPKVIIILNKQNIMNKAILVKDGERKFLKELFNTTYPTVRSALRGYSKTELARNIRMAAIARGGVEIEDAPITKAKKI